MLRRCSQRGGPACGPLTGVHPRALVPSYAPLMGVHPRALVPAYGPLMGVHPRALVPATPSTPCIQGSTSARATDTHGRTGKPRTPKREQHPRESSTQEPLRLGNRAREGRGGDSSLNENRTLRVGAVSSGD